MRSYPLTSNYTLYEDGSIKNTKDYQLKPFIGTNGYLTVQIRHNKKRYGYTLHRLLAIAFIPKIADKDFVNHIDGNKLNNALANLEWCTTQENTNHAKSIGRLESAQNNRDITIDGITYPSRTKAAKALGIGRGTFYYRYVS